jgi:hypothetical protein
MGRIYSVSFTEVGVTAQQDLFQLEAVTVPAILHAVYLSQSSDLGDASSEGLSILVRRVTDTVPSPYTTAEALDPGSATASTIANVNDITELVTGASNIHTEAWNILTPFIYLPPPELRPVVKIGDVITVNLNTTPNDSITMSGTLYFEEIGG